MQPSGAVPLSHTYSTETQGTMTSHYFGQKGEIVMMMVIMMMMVTIVALMMMMRTMAMMMIHENNDDNDDDEGDRNENSNTIW
jgi:uncharacterized membrane protein